MYTSDKCYTGNVSEVIETNILKKMRKSSHFALMFDETTDCCVTEQLAIHGRYIERFNWGA